MGIPGLFSWIRSTSPMSIKYKSPIGTPVDGLFVDVNAALYSVARSWPSASKEEYLDSLNTYILHAMSHFKPCLILYLAMDGVAPASKMLRQRARRAESPNKDQDDDGYPEWWNKCATSTGTRFMTQVADNLREFAQQVSDYWKITVLLSSTNVPGEGEQKLMDHAHRMVQRPLTLCILGGDADITVMAMNLVEDSKTILCARDAFSKRPTPSTGFMHVNVNILRKSLLGRLTKNPHDSNFRRVVSSLQKQIVLDWIAMMCFVGNDFLPSLPSLSVYAGGIDKLLDAYKESVLKQRKRLVYFNDAGTLVLDHEGMEMFLQRLVLSERDDARLVDSLAIERDTVTPPTETAWALRYNELRFGRELDSVCDSYFAGIEWTVDYYTRVGCPDIDWHYRFHHAPTISALIRRLRHRTVPLWMRNKTPPPPLNQLVNITSPSSADEVPEAWRWLLTSVNSPISELIHDTMTAKKDGRYKLKEFQADLLIPYFNPHTLISYLDEDQLTQEEARRNAVLSVEVFKNGRAS